MRDSFKTLSKFEILNLILLQIVSIYVIQRDLSWVFSEEGPVTLYTANFQYEYSGFAFFYVTLSLIWPLVLLMLCTALTILAKRKTDVGKEIALKNENEGKFSFDPFFIQEIICESKLYRMIISILLYVPIFSIFIHLLQSVLYFFYGNITPTQQSQGGLSGDSFIYLILGIQFVVTLVSLLLVIKTPKKVLSYWNDLNNTVPNTV